MSTANRGDTGNLGFDLLLTTFCDPSGAAANVSWFDFAVGSKAVGSKCWLMGSLLRSTGDALAATDSARNFCVVCGLRGRRDIRLLLIEAVFLQF
jgi:hypothetical protein